MISDNIWPKKATRDAYAAIYKAREKEEDDIAYSGYFLLMRIAVTYGNYKDAIMYEDKSKDYIDSLEKDNLFNTYLL